MNEQIYIKSAFKEELENLKIGIVDYITVYRVEGDKVFFSANRGKFHMTRAELEEVRLA
jgi:hypothetical protein